MTRGRVRARLLYSRGVSIFGGGDSQGPSPARITIWIIAGGVGVYFVVSGIIGILTSGG